MRYWVYINDKVEGPFEEERLVTLQGFTPDTLICTESTEAGAAQEWVKASSVFEFDPLESTITRALPTPEELNTAVAPAGSTDPNLTQALKDAHSASQIETPAAAPAVSDDVSRLILEKLDSLTREIESLKGKMEEVITAASAAQAAAPQTLRQAMTTTAISGPELDDAVNTITLTNRDMSAPAPQDDTAATTESLVSQAESLVAEATGAENKPVDFLQGIDLGTAESETAHATEPPAEISLGSQGEEEVVLRSALDSLYGAATIQEEQSEKEKEATFQDLLRPRQKNAAAAQPEPSKPTLDDALKAQTADEQQKEEVLKEFAAEEHKDFIAEALAEAEREEKAKKNEEAVAVAAAAAPAGENNAPQDKALEDLTPVTPEQEAAIKTDLPQEPASEVPVLPIAGEQPAAREEEKQSLDLGEPAPAMSVMQDEPAVQQPQPAQPAEEAAQPMVEEVPLQTVSAMMPGLANLGGEEAPDQAQKQQQPQEPETEEANTETIQELVPGAKLQDRAADEPISVPEGGGDILSEADLKNAKAPEAQSDELPAEPVFSSEEPQTAPEMNEPQVLPSLEPAEETPAQPVQEAAPEVEKTTTQAEYTPNDLTEIELKEGSTYLISDFVPPAQAEDFAAAAQAAMEKSQANLNAASAKNARKSDAEEIIIEEVVPTANRSQSADAAKEPESPLPGADVTVSQIILENTIKTKRGASLDLKTVPMVKDPADSQRLDLGDTELQDINTQHDLKSADIPGAKKTKTTLMLAVLLVVLIAIYAGLGYLQLIPDNFNLVNPKPARTETEQTEQLDEMLPAAPMQAAPQVNPTDMVLGDVKRYLLPNGMTLEQLIASRHPNAGAMVEWSISTAVDPDNYSVMVKVPPENPQSFKISYRFNYNTVTKSLEPTISDSKNLLMSAGVRQAPPQQDMMAQQQAMQQQAMQQRAAQQRAVQQRPVQQQQRAARPQR